MNLADASRLVGRLKAAFPRITLDEEEMGLVIKEVALLADALVCNEAIDQIIRREERFPAIATIRSYYHAAQNAHRPPALPEQARSSEMPEWVHVWFWQMHRTRTERQAAREGSLQRVEDRAPIPMQDFPQYEHPSPDAITPPEYEKIRDEWLAAGSPTVGSVAEILATVG